MKLKKIASLALAGVMAVSMLAGCSVKPGTQDPTDGQVNTTVDYAALLNEKVNNSMIKFTYDSTLQSDLEIAIKAEGGASASNATAVESTLAKVMQKTDEAISAFQGYNVSTGTAALAKKTQYAIMVVASDQDMTAKQTVANFYNQKNTSDFQYVGALKDKVTLTANDVDYTFAYAGKVAVVKAADDDGNYITYVAAVVSCDTTGVKNDQ